MPLQGLTNSITSYKAPAIPSVLGANAPIGGQRPPEFNIMGALGNFGRSVVSGYQAAAAQHTPQTFAQGTSPLTQQGALNTTQPLLGSGVQAFPTNTGTNFGIKPPVGTGNAPSPLVGSQTGSPQTQNNPILPGSSPLATTGTFQTPNGGTFSTDPNNPGSITGYTPPPGYKINTDKPASTDALNSNFSYQDLTSQRNKYSDYLQGLFQATQPNQNYISAMTQLNNAKLQGQKIQADFLTDPNFPGQTYGFAQGIAGRAGALNTLDQTAAANNLAVQEAIRSGNIDAYKALVQGTAPQGVSPGSSLVSPLDGSTTYGGAGAYSDYQAQQTYFNLAQSFPDAQIPAYNPQMSAQQNLQNAQGLAAKAPSFQSKNLVQVTLPGGGISFVNRNQLVTDPKTGAYNLISSSDASTAQGLQSSTTDLTKQRGDVDRAITTADANFPLLLQAAKDAGVNNSSPLVNQFQQKLGSKFSTSPAFAALQTLIPSLQTEYSQIISRGGTVTNETRDNAQAIVNGTYSLGQLQSVFNTLQAESKNVLKGYDTAIQKNSDSLNKIYSSGSSIGGNTGGSTGGSTGGFAETW